MPNEPMDPTTAFFYCLGAAVAFAVFYFIIRWILDIPGRKRHYEVQTQLLAKMALKLGVDKDEINKILSYLTPSDELPNNQTQPTNI